VHAIFTTRRGIVPAVHEWFDALVPGFQEAERYAADLAQKPAGTLSRIRRLLRDGAARTPDAATAAELAALNELTPLLAASRPT
jgi:hypothetical protein